MKNSKILSIILRYLIVCLLGLFNLKLFYYLFGPLTVFGTGFVLGLFSNVLVFGRTIIFNSNVFEIVNACVIGSAYYLLFILFMSFQDIRFFKRIFIILLSFFLLYVVNVLRILFLIFIFEKSYFVFAHWIFWNFVSTVFVLGIFFFIVFIFKLKEIPFQKDFLYFFRLVYQSKSKKGNVKRN